MVWVQLVIVAGFVLVHVLGGGLRFLDVIPRSCWLSFAGGISVAYVFVHILPELAEAQEKLGGGGEGAEGGLAAVLPWLQHHAYLAAVTGLALFYGLERMVKSGQVEDGEGGATCSEKGVFWVHIGSFALYNALIGYLLVHREEQDLRSLGFFGGAMLLHFLVNDFGLRQAHRDRYQKRGRWVLAVAVVGGWLLGLATPVSEAWLAVFFSFLAGGLILNVLKEELPEERQSRFLAFVAGTVLYAGLLLFF